MAYYNSNTGTTDSSLGMNKKEEDDKTGTAPQLTNTAASTAAPLNGNPIGQAAPKAASSGMGGGFQSYQKANQGTASNRLNEAAQSNVANQGAVAQTGIAQATDQFGKKVDAGTLANRQQALQDVSNTINNARTTVAPPKPAAAPQVSATSAPSPAPAAPFNIAGADRFKEVINAKYQGPESLRQSGLYQDAASKVGTAQTALNQTKTAAGREDMLKDMYSKRGEYNRGLNKLDASILNSSQDGVKNLQSTADAQGNLAQQLDKAQFASGNLAQNRTDEIRGIRDQAKNTFTEGQKAERLATDNRLSQVVKDWDKLPEYFRDIIRNKDKDNAAINSEAVNKFKAENNYDQVVGQNVNEAQQALNLAQQGISSSMGDTPQQKAAKENAYFAAISQLENANKSKSDLEAKLSAMNNSYNKNAVGLNSFESSVLGVGNGEGLYTMGENSVAKGTYDKSRLITRDEQARQAALSQLAGLDDSNMLDTSLVYNNADKAGTQTALDALDLEQTRRNFNDAEQSFRDTAEKTTLTGEGSKKVSRGNAAGKKTKTYNASVSGNAGDFLEGAGYNLDGKIGQGQTPADGQRLLQAALERSRAKSYGNADQEDNDKVVGATVKGGAAGASIGSAIPGVGTAIGAVIGAGLGSTIGSGTLDNFQTYSDLLRGFGGPAAAVGKGIQDVRQGAKGLYDKTSGKLLNSVGLGELGKGVGGMIGGIDSGAMKKLGDSVANQNAVADLKNKYTNFLDGQGFNNRVNVVDNEKTQQRMSGLEAILADINKNRG